MFHDAAMALQAELERDGPMPLKAAADAVKRLPGTEALLKRFKGGFAQFLRLFPELFVVAKGYVKLIGQSLWISGKAKAPLRLPTPRAPDPPRDLDDWLTTRILGPRGGGQTPLRPHATPQVAVQPPPRRRDLLRPEPLTEMPTDGHSTDPFSSTDAEARAQSTTSSAFDFTLLPDPWIVLARHYTSGRGMDLDPFELRRLALTFQERFAYNTDAWRELEG